MKNFMDVRMSAFWVIYIVAIDALLEVDLKTNKARAVAMQRAVNTPLQQYNYFWKRCFLLGPYKGAIRKTIEGITGPPYSCGI
jgi:hypothetical protein